MNDINNFLLAGLIISVLINVILFVFSSRPKVVDDMLTPHSLKQLEEIKMNINEASVKIESQAATINSITEQLKKLVAKAGDTAALRQQLADMTSNRDSLQAQLDALNNAATQGGQLADISMDNLVKATQDLGATVNTLDVAGS